MIPLTSAEIHIWLAFYDEITDERLHAAYREVLDDAERAQEPRFYFATDRLRYLVTRALVRTILSRYVPVAPREWVFEANAYGRPEIVKGQAGAAELSFNVSHTQTLIVLGVTAGRALGVDVENVRRREVSLDVASHYFAPPEVSDLLAAPRHEQQYRFFEYWTFKESYIKARGMGLSLPLDKFSFRYPHGRAVEIDIHPELADDGVRWQFWQFQPTPEYVVAICAERVAGPTRLVVRRAVPMQAEQAVAPQLLRVSACAPTPYEIHDGG